MKEIFFVFGLCIFSIQIFAQSSDCYKTLLQRGIEEYNKNNFSEAILKWETAKDNCPNISQNEKKTLSDWIIKAKKEKVVILPTSTSVEKSKSSRKRNVINKIDTIYIDKPIEKIVYVEKPVEKTIYIEKPEPFHKYGKGFCRLLIYTQCTTGYIKIWVDGEYWGQLTSHLYSAPDCNETEYTLYSSVVSGKHHIQGENTSTKRTWNFYVTIAEDDCFRQGLTCNN